MCLMTRIYLLHADSMSFHIQNKSPGTVFEVYGINKSPLPYLHFSQKRKEKLN